MDEGNLRDSWFVLSIEPIGIETGTGPNLLFLNSGSQSNLLELKLAKESGLLLTPKSLNRTYWN